MRLPCLRSTSLGVVAVAVRAALPVVTMGGAHTLACCVRSRIGVVAARCWLSPALLLAFLSNADHAEEHEMEMEALESIFETDYSGAYAPAAHWTVRASAPR